MHYKEYNKIIRSPVYYVMFVLISVALFYLSLSMMPSMPIPFSILKHVNAQVLGPEDLVTYTARSDFIKEFKVPLAELGLKGITTDADGNAWFYHSTNQNSTILALNLTTQQFKQYTIEGRTLVDPAIINLAGGQIVYDDKRNAIWFTDARTNSIGNLDIKKGIIRLYNIPTPNSGPMGIVLSPDRNELWFAEITGNKLGKMDIESIGNNDSINNSNLIEEYPVFEQPGEQTSGPTLLTFDDKGVLWVTMSYSHDILRVEPWTLISSSKYLGMSNFSLPKPDLFSPFGIAAIDDNVNTSANDTKNHSETEGILVSDHGSSRLVLATGDPALDPFQNYLSYWTSPSKVYPVTLPSQIAADKSEDNVYFVQHGGNRISKIDLKSGIMTEYDIPTGPLSTAVFLTVSDNGEKVWFTEYAANKIAYLDTTVPIPFEMQITENQNQDIYNSNQSIGNQNDNSVLVLKPSEERILDVMLKTDKINSDDKRSNNTLNNITSLSTLSEHLPLFSLNEIELSVIGMTDSGLVPGFTYSANPQRINMSNDGSSNTAQIQTNRTYDSKIKLVLEEDNIEKISQNKYSVMIKSSALEDSEQQPQRVEHPLFVSLLFPIPVLLDLPLSTISDEQQVSDKDLVPNNNSSDNQSLTDSFFGIRDISLLSTIRILSLSGAIGLVGYLIYAKVRRKRKSNKK